MRARKKALEVECIQYNGLNVQEVLDLGGQAIVPIKGWTFGKDLLINTLEGIMRCRKYDWVIKGVGGEVYPCKPHLFAQTYDIIDSNSGSLKLLAPDGEELTLTPQMVKILQNGIKMAIDDFIRGLGIND